MTTGPEYDGTRDVPIDPKTWDTSALKKDVSEFIDRRNLNDEIDRHMELLSNRQLLIQLRMPSTRYPFK